MAKKKTKTKDSASQPSFEETLQSLEKIVHELEDNKLGLGDALDRYEQGIQQLKQCNQLLEQAEQKVNLLAGVDEQGNPIVQPFQEENSDANE